MRRRLLASLACVSLVTATTACTVTDSTRPDDASPTPVEPGVSVVLAPDETEADADATEEPSATEASADPSAASGTDATKVNPAQVELPAGQNLHLRADNAEFLDVEVTTAEGEDIEVDNGEFADATTWESNYGLAGSEEYDWSATIKDAEGNEIEKSGSVTTAAATGDEARTTSIIADEQTVGVAAPITLLFSGTVDAEHRDDLEHRLTVTAKDADGEDLDIEGSWAWLADADGNSRLHFRPKDYWPAHTTVSVDAPVGDMQFTDSTHGAKDMTLDFEVGREQLVTASAKTHRMVVTRDGKEIWDWPASLGSKKAPSYNGIHVVMSKHEDYTMTSEQWDYETDVKWAVRIHNNGEFIHAAPWSEDVQGSENVSHGCINVSTERAKKYYDSAIYGDPVIIKDSAVDLSQNGSDISDWVYSWDTWQSLSALHDTEPGEGLETPEPTSTDGATSTDGTTSTDEATESTSAEG